MTGKQEVSMCDRVIRAFGTRGVAMPLCDCGVAGRVWEVFDDLTWISTDVSHTTFDSSGWSVSHRRAPMVLLTCRGCGQARFYSAMFLGIVDDRGDLTPVPPDPSPASGKVGP